MQSTDHSERRERLIGTLNEIADILSGRGDPGSANLARGTAERLSEETFHVVVVGAFKRGKTTLVNAMLGGEYLPAAVVPLTSVITHVTTGSDVGAEIVFTDGRRKRVSMADLPRYVTEPGNPSNGLGVERAIVTMPAGVLAHGVVLIDTPGIDSIYRHNTDVARRFLSQADAAILVTSADPPISDSELEFLREVRGETARIFVVMNKVDHLSLDDREESRAFTSQVIDHALGHEADLYPVSARAALDAQAIDDEIALEASGSLTFARDLNGFLVHDRGDASIASAEGRATRLTADALRTIVVEERGLELSSADLARSRTEIERIFGEAARARDDLGTLLDREADRIVATIEQDLAAMVRHTVEVLLERVDASLDREGSLRTAASDLEDAVRTGLRDELDRWRESEDRRIRELLRQTTARFGDEADRLLARTLHLSGDALGLELTASPGEAELPAASRFSYDFFRVPTIVESLVPDMRGHLPRRLARRKLGRDFRAKIPPLVDKHRGRLRYDYVQRVDEARRILQRALGERLRTTEQALRAALDRSAAVASDDEEWAHQRRTKLADERGRLIGLRDRVGESGRQEVSS